MSPSLQEHRDERAADKAFDRNERADDKAFDRGERADNLDYDRAWHVDRKIPIALIVTIVSMFVTQTMTGVWWAAGMNNRVDNLERGAIAMNAAIAPRMESVIRLETKVDGLFSSLSELKAMLHARDR